MFQLFFSHKKTSLISNGFPVIFFGKYFNILQRQNIVFAFRQYHIETFIMYTNEYLFFGLYCIQNTRIVLNETSKRTQILVTYTCIQNPI